MKISTYIKLAAAITVIVLLLGGFFWLRGLTEGDHFSFGSDDQIDVTPTQIMSIKAIGEWEFLSVNAEELVDTVRKGFFSDDELARIYYGTLRLGIDMSQLEAGWIETNGDSVTLLLPQVGLLDAAFIDEARTKSFFESGKWSPEDKVLQCFPNMVEEECSQNTWLVTFFPSYGPPCAAPWLPFF